MHGGSARRCSPQSSMDQPSPILPMLPCSEAKQMMNATNGSTASSAREPPQSAPLGHIWPASAESTLDVPRRTFASGPKKTPPPLSARTPSARDSSNHGSPLTRRAMLDVDGVSYQLYPKIDEMCAVSASMQAKSSHNATGDFSRTHGSSSVAPSEFLSAVREAGQVFSGTNTTTRTRDGDPQSHHAEDTLQSANSSIGSYVNRKGEFKLTFSVTPSLAKSEQVAEVDRFLVANGSRLKSSKHRNTAFRKGMEELAKVYPSILPITAQTNRYLKELEGSARKLEATYAKAHNEQERALYKKFESFFEEKIYAILRDKKKAELQSKELHDEVLMLRKERDEDLMQVKADLMKRLNECEKREDDFRYFRQLIAAVFKTNGQLTNRIEDLELILKKHRIDIPPAPSDLYAYRDTTHDSPDGPVSTQTAGGRQRGGGNNLYSSNMGELMQIPPEFMKASKEELNMSRLTLQQELLHCAFDDRSAYRLQINGMKQENNELKFQLAQLESSVTQLNRYIHEKRFLGTDADGSPVEAMTPRPRDVPFSIQTELGIDLHKSTSEIFAELTAVANNLKHQLNSSLVRLRQLTTVSEWMQEDTLIELDVERNETGVLPTFPVSMWPAIPHFLRTHISPDVCNFRWTQADSGAIFLEFFNTYKEMRAKCRYVRDSKMVAPRHLQQYERREVLLGRLDATKEDMKESEDNVPFGYVVSHFIYNLLMELAPRSKENALLLPGTLHPRFTTRGENRVVEIEFTRFAYNMWWAAYRYRYTQPMCRLFLEVASGRLPLELFDQMQRSLHVVERSLQILDTDGSRSYTYGRLVGGVLRMVSDLDSQAARGGILAVVQTFEENGAPIVAGRVRYAEVTADESFCAREPNPGEVIRTTQNNLPPSVTIRRMPGRTIQPPGASVFVRFWRRLVIQRYERVYNLVERIMSPLVVESDVVVGLYLLPVPEALARTEQYHADVIARTAEYTRDKFPSLAEDGMIPTHQAEDASEAYGAAAHAAPELTQDYLEMMKERAEVVRIRETAERIMLMTIVEPLFAEMPRLNRSVHFPFTHDPNNNNGSRVATADQRLHHHEPLSATDMSQNGAPSTSSNQSPQAPSTRKANGKPPARKKKVPRSRASSVASSVPHHVVDGTPSKRRNRKKGRTAESQLMLPAQMLEEPDRELVEWYSFCHKLRQSAISFSEKLFTTVDPLPLDEAPKDKKASEEEEGKPADNNNNGGAESVSAPQNDETSAASAEKADAPTEEEKKN